MNLRTALAPLRHKYGARLAMLLTGAGLAQLTPILSYPIITRLFTPAEYGSASILASVAAVGAVVAAGRYQLAVLLPENDSDAVRVATLALGITIGTSLVFTIAVTLIHGHFDQYQLVGQLGIWIFLLPLLILLGSTQDVLSYHSIRGDNYAAVTRANVARSIVAPATQISVGVIGAGMFGLVIGHIASLAAASGMLTRPYISASRTIGLNWHRMRELATEYSRFPKYDLWSSLINALSYNSITLGIGLLYSANVVGYYAMAYRAVALPSALIGAAVGQIYLREAARRRRSPSAALRAYDRVALALASVSLAPFLTIFLCSESFFAAGLGESWRASGLLASALTPMLWVRFVASPLSSVYLIYGAQRALLLWQVALLAVTLATFYLASELNWDPQRLVTMQSVASAPLYGFLLIRGRQIVRKSG